MASTNPSYRNLKKGTTTTTTTPSEPIIEDDKDEKDETPTAAKSETQKAFTKGEIIKKAIDKDVPGYVAKDLSGEQMKAGTDVGTGKDGADKIGPQNKGGLINKPKRKPKKPRGKGLGSR